MISRISQAKQELSKISEDNFLIVVDEFGNEYPIECITRLIQMIPIISAMLLKFIRQIWDVYGEEERVSDKNST